MKDLVVGSVNGVDVYIGLTDTDFTELLSKSIPPYCIIFSPFFADISEDGLMDIIVANSSPTFASQGLTVIENTGTSSDPSFGVPEFIELPMEVRLIIDVADYTGNGHPDLLVCTNPTALVLFENLGEMQFGEPQEVPVCDPLIYDNLYISGSAVDYDADGVKELVLSLNQSIFTSFWVVLCECSQMGLETGDADSPIRASFSSNPASGSCSVSLFIDESSEVVLSVHSLDGRVVSRSRSLYPAGASTVQLDMTGQAAGVYLLRAVSSKGYCTGSRFTLIR